MTPEQRAAAERVRRAVEANRTFDVQVLGCANEEFEFRQFFRDIQLLAINVALAEHLADDDEPVTLDFMESVVPEDGSITIGIRCGEVGRVYLDEGYVADGIVIKTRGQLRDLLKLLKGPGR